MQKLRTKLGVGLSILLVAAACGGGGTSESQPPATTDSGGTPDSSEPGPESSPPETEGVGGTESDTSTAEVTIDGTTYSFGDFGPGTQCEPDLFGGFTATLRSEDGSGVFGVELWPQGGDRGNQADVLITVDGVKMDLSANPDQEEFWPAVEAGTSMVQSFQIDGNVATGVAAFVDDEVAYDASLFPLEPIIGEFSVICATDG